MAEKYGTIDPRLLKPHPLNAEIYEDREDPLFEMSIREHGILVPIEINRENVIISGVRRWKAALKLGLEVSYSRLKSGACGGGSNARVD